MLRIYRTHQGGGQGAMRSERTTPTGRAFERQIKDLRVSKRRRERDLFRPWVLAAAPRDMQKRKYLCAHPRSNNAPPFRPEPVPLPPTDTTKRMSMYTPDWKRLTLFPNVGNRQTPNVQPGDVIAEICQTRHDFVFPSERRVPADWNAGLGGILVRGLVTSVQPKAPHEWRRMSGDRDNANARYTVDGPELFGLQDGADLMFAGQVPAGDAMRHVFIPRLPEYQTLSDFYLSRTLPRN